MDVDLFEVAIPLPPEEVLLVHEALEDLAHADAEAAQFVRLRFFVGMALDEAAGLLGISTRTADRMWDLAKAWLQRTLQAEPPSGVLRLRVGGRHFLRLGTGHA